MSGLSSRGHLNLTQVIAKIPKSILEPIPNPNAIDLSMAENHLIREEILQIVKSSIAGNLHSKHLDWPKGFCGDSDLLGHLKDIFNKRFHPFSTVKQEHVTITSGAAACLDAVLYTICDPGDGVLVPTPYWGGYDAFFTSHSGVKPAGVDVSDLEDSLGPALIDALEDAYEKSKYRIRALVLCNPHNPLGRCYSKKMLEDCAKFCHSRGIHLISDEVFALSSFKSPDLPDAPEFASVLSLDPRSLGCDPERIHAIWSMSKDLAASGIRLGCIVTLNKDLRDAIGLIGSIHVSALSTVASKAILCSPGLPDLLELNSKRLAEAYLDVITFFKSSDIAYIPCNSAIFMLAKLAPLAKSQIEEMAVFLQYIHEGVMVAPGWAYHINESQRGWMRVSFAMSNESLQEGLKRIKLVYDKVSAAQLS